MPMDWLGYVSTSYVYRPNEWSRLSIYVCVQFLPIDIYKEISVHWCIITFLVLVKQQYVGTHGL